MSDLPPPRALKPLKTTESESSIQAKVCRYARDKGALVYQFDNRPRAGAPDRLFVPPSGNVFWIEFKRPGGKTSPAQDREIDALRERRQHVYIIDSVEEGKRVVDQHCAFTR